jgi:hypothetical protein
MKLSKTIREKFVSDVLAGIPIKHHFNMQDAKSEIINGIEEQLPLGLLQTVKTYPQVIQRHKYYKLDTLYYINSDGYKRTPEIYVVNHASCEMIDLSKWLLQKKLAESEHEERKVLQKRLTEITASCTTLAKLKLALPELESYMPVEEVKRNLPIASGTVITDLIQFGLKIPKST